MAAAAIGSGNATQAADAALECQKSAEESLLFVQKELESSIALRRSFEEKGVMVDAIQGGEPVEVLQHIGERDGLHSVVWRAGCWGQRGVQAIMDGAFQWISAHIAVPAG